VSPVVDGVFVPRTPLVTAEQHVGFHAIDTHILTRRRRLESEGAPFARRIGYVTAHLGITPAGIQERLADRLAAGLEETARFGYRTAQAEVRSLRRARPRDARHAARAGLLLPDAGRYGRLAMQGLPGLLLVMKHRGIVVAAAVSQAASDAAKKTEDKTAASLAAIAAAQRQLHNGVLELIGEALNMGRTAGALAMPEPPTFAMRSEQLDGNTCDSCNELHGTIVEVDSADYYSYMPPEDCEGGGRCRGVYVYGDAAADVSAPVEEAA
jgi:hypothetical protein